MKFMALMIIMAELLSSCTYSITMVETEGSASDVVDEASTPSTSVSPTLSIPSTTI